MSPKNLKPVRCTSLAWSTSVFVLATALSSAASAQTSDPAPENAEIIVIGRYQTKDAKSQQLQAETTTTVLTAKDLTRAPDENVAASLSRVPGVTAISGGFGNSNGVAIDLAGRGEANFITLRGLPAAYNVNLINGVDVAQGRPYDRQIQLNLLPPTGLQTIVVHKSLSADMPGDAVGGIVDFRTPNAFDFKGNLAFSVDGGIHVESRAIDYKRNALGFSFAADVAKKFGADEQFGLYVSAYYDRRNFSNSVIDGIYPASANGQYAFAQQTATGASQPVADLSQNLVSTGVNYGLSEGQSKRFGGSISLDFKPTDTLSAYVRATYAQADIDQGTYYLQFYGNNVTRTQIGTSGTFVPQIPFIKTRYYYETNPEAQRLGTVQAGLSATFGQLTVNPNIFYSWGENSAPNHIELSARIFEVGPGVPYTGSSLFSYARNGIPFPLVSGPQLTALTNFGQFGARRQGDFTPEFSTQRKGGAKIDAVYAFGETGLTAIDFGVKYQTSRRDHSLRDYTSKRVFVDDNGPRFADLGILQGSVSQLVPGVINVPAPLINTPALFNLFNTSITRDFGTLINASDQCGSDFIVDNENCGTQRGTETIYSAYVSANLKFGDVQIIPGIRYEHTDIGNTYYVLRQNAAGQAIPGSFESNRSKYDKLLPSIQLNIRPNRSSVYRASIWTSYVRPTLFQLGGTSQIANTNGGAANGGTTTITQGNPNLKAIDAVNFDASAEWVSQSGGSASVAVFYKTLNNFLFDSINAFNNATPDGNGSTIITRPVNGGKGRVYGIELAASQKFTGAPAPFDGFGLSGNVTIERSRVNTGVPGLDTNERLLNQPNFGGNVQFFYEKGPIEAQLSYRYIGPYVLQYATVGTSSQLDTFVRESNRVDLHIGYRTSFKVRLDLGVANLLNNRTYYATIGRNSTAIPSIVDSGRIYTASLKYVF